jgi:hypothetical protein
MWIARRVPWWPVKSRRVVLIRFQTGETPEAVIGSPKAFCGICELVVPRKDVGAVTIIVGTVR